MGRETMTPVAYMGRFNTDDIRESGVVVTRGKDDLKYQRKAFGGRTYILPDRIDPLFTEDQLRAAQVRALRGAAEKFKHDCDCGMPCDCYGPSTAKFQLLDIAKELEAGK